METVTLPPVWTTPVEAKRSIVEETLLQAFNPFESLEQEHPPVKKRQVITYTVKEGDTLSEIAFSHGTTLEQLIEDNKIANPHLVGIGMKLIIRRQELTHIVKQGETLDQIAARYNVKKEEIIHKNPVLQLLPDQLYNGQVLQVPLPQPIPQKQRVYQNVAKKVNVTSRSLSRSWQLDWPIENAVITSKYGKRWGRMHKGLDLWSETKGRTPILAAQNGVVVEAGATRGGYGYMVVIDHGNGMQTLYAHMRRISVRKGQQVKRGQKLGYMGNTGDSTGYHLHFEVRVNDEPINPLRYLR